MRGVGYAMSIAAGAATLASFCCVVADILFYSSWLFGRWWENDAVVAFALAAAGCSVSSCIVLAISAERRRPISRELWLALGINSLSLPMAVLCFILSH